MTLPASATALATPVAILAVPTSAPARARRENLNMETIMSVVNVAAVYVLNITLLIAALAIFVSFLPSSDKTER